MSHGVLQFSSIYVTPYPHHMSHMLALPLQLVRLVDCMHNSNSAQTPTLQTIQRVVFQHSCLSCPVEASPEPSPKLAASNSNWPVGKVLSVDAPANVAACRKNAVGSCVMVPSVAMD